MSGCGLFVVLSSIFSPKSSTSRWAEQLCEIVGISYVLLGLIMMVAAVASECLTSEHLTTLLNNGTIRFSARVSNPRVKNVEIPYDSDSQEDDAARISTGLIH